MSSSFSASTNCLKALWAFEKVCILFKLATLRQANFFKTPCLCPVIFFKNMITYAKKLLKS